MTWIFNDKEYTEQPSKKIEGFVYLITNLKEDKKYIGKKSFWSRRKDKKTGRRKTEESDWREYYGSNEELKYDVCDLGKENFRREILYICPHKKSMSFYETYEQFNRKVILDEKYYNTNIGGKYFSSEKTKIYEAVDRSTQLLL